MLATALTYFFSGFALFLAGFSVFMYRENRKFGDNQFTMKLLPPPPRKGATPVAGHARTFIAGIPGSIRPELASARALARSARSD